MRNRTREAWISAASILAGGGCGALVGLDGDHYLHDPAGGGASDGGGGAGTGGAGGGEACTPGGTECVDQACVEGECTGECGPDDVRCSGGQPQRCDERGAWVAAAPCPAAAPVCDAGKCTAPPRSCNGLDETCGPAAKPDETCCAVREVPGGTFARQDDAGISSEVAVSKFVLDRFEVTVGRFRKFVEQYPGSKPEPGAGGHPRHEMSGWAGGEWEQYLPQRAAELREAITCGQSAAATWTDEPGENENLPMNCLSWYEAFAFCAWDGGRLPTDAEWHYAAAGGSEERMYPWSPSSDAIDTKHAVYGCSAEGSDAGSCIMPVGSLSVTGDGRWEQADLAGNVREWVLDSHPLRYDPACESDCASMNDDDDRVVRGGGFLDDAQALRSSARQNFPPMYRDTVTGVRCARNP
ncbi:formylglycine-generating enzyme family protein [Sorangium sp. So ce1335]|uniref:formylglycine-generating enzyme family protein n=1 Tax=Sorangium sp. So ce1335 TaxID=3133335 RepID=UPI003F600ADB